MPGHPQVSGLLDSENEDGSVSSWLSQLLMDVRENLWALLPSQFSQDRPSFFPFKICTFLCSSHGVGPRWRDLTVSALGPHGDTSLSKLMVPTHTETIVVKDIHRSRLALTGRNKWACLYLKWSLLQYEGIALAYCISFYPVWLLPLGDLLFSEEETEGKFIWGRKEVEAELGDMQGEETMVRMYGMRIYF